MATKAFITDYLRAIEERRLDDVAAMLHPDMELIEHPNQINPAGKRYNKAEIRAAGERGAKALTSERYTLRSLIIEGDRAAALLSWVATLHDGRTMRGQFCSILEMRDGLLIRQEQYDCFERMT
ncbi:MAG: nuclear transport factor 2 family protein [Kofleriaceae bacterium]|nr:nuclear transport factor 2 family protein [Kofleriaceae bacterium]